MKNRHLRIHGQETDDTSSQPIRTGEQTDSGLTRDLLNVFLREKKGTDNEQQQLREIIAKIHDDIYTDAAFLLTGTRPANSAEAKKLIVDIIKHRNMMIESLRRNVSFQVAAIDYQENIRNILTAPELIPVDRYRLGLGKTGIGISVSEPSSKAFDRKLFDIDLEKEIERTKRLNAHLSLMFIDIDDGRINENNLDILMYVSGSIHKSLRKYDSVYVYGRFRFAVILPLTNAKEAESVAVRIIRSIKHSDVDYIQYKPDINIGITSSVGETLQDGRQAAATSSAAAEKALVAAKKSGKNQVFISTENTIHKSAATFPEATGKKTITIKGNPLALGFASGIVFHYNDIISRYLEMRDILPEEIDFEMERMRSAVSRVREDIDLIRRQSEEEQIQERREIFDVHLSLLDDGTLLEELERKLKEQLLNAEQVVKNVFHQLVRKFRASASLLIQEKATDIEDIGKRILRKLTGMEENVLSAIPENSVVFARRLLPSDVVHLRRKNTKAIITEQGGDASFSAIFARSLGIPAISGIITGKTEIPDAAEVLVDGYSGTIVVHPSPEMKQEFETEHERKKCELYSARKELKKIIPGYNNERIYIDINLAVRTDIDRAAAFYSSAFDATAAGFDNIGLLRLEPLYLQNSSLPTEVQLFTGISNLLRYFKKNRITIRLTDFGHTILPSYINANEEHRSALGIRGVRFLLEYPEILTDQLRVCLLLSNHFDIRIMIPMVTIPEDVIIVRELLETQKDLFAKKRIKFNEAIKLGSMIEMPSAMFVCEEIFKVSDFTTIGSNDLIQFTMAADRQLGGVSSYFEHGHSIIIPQLETVVRKAGEAGMELCLCGELAGNTRFTEKLLKAGFRHFSVAPSMIQNLKETILSIGKG